jgi:hypothetical protein
MKCFILAAALLVAAPALAQDPSFASMGGFGGMGDTSMSFKVNVRYSESSPNYFVAENAEVTMNMMGMASSASSPVDGSLTVVAGNRVRVVSQTDSGTFDHELRAAIQRDKSGAIRSLRIAAKEFGAHGGQLFSIQNGGQGMTMKAGDLTCTGKSHGLQCKQTVKIDMGM